MSVMNATAAGLAIMERTRMNQDYIVECLQKQENAFTHTTSSPVPLATTPLMNIKTELQEINRQITILRRVGVPAEQLASLSAEQQRQVARVQNLINQATKGSCFAPPNRPKLELPKNVQSLVGCFAGPEFFCVLNTTCRDDALVARFMTTPDQYVQAVRKKGSTIAELNSYFFRIVPREKRRMVHFAWIAAGKPPIREFDVSRVAYASTKLFHVKIVSNYMAATNLLHFARTIRVDGHSNHAYRTNAKCFEALRKGDGDHAQNLLLDGCTIMNDIDEEDSLYDQTVGRFDRCVQEVASRLGNNLSLLPNHRDREANRAFGREFTNFTHHELWRRFTILRETSPQAARLLAFAVGNWFLGKPDQGENYIHDTEEPEDIESIVKGAEAITEFEYRPLRYSTIQTDERKEP